jgi:leucine dehydrogenase
MYEEWMRECNTAGFGELHAKFDPETGLRCVVAIHDLTAGPSLGGCRIRSYHSTHEAMEDVLRLARGMTLKSLMAGLPLGGGKAVIWQPEGQSWDRKALFSAFGDFVDSLGGKYITAVDMGTSVEDMDVIREKTTFVTCTSACSVGPSDPSSLTALGVFHGMRAAVKHKYGKSSLSGLKVAIQGVGHVGFHLAERLHQAGAELVVSDANSAVLAECQQRFNATTRTLEDIYAAECDVFSPCAIGGTLSHETIPQLKASIIAGAANNQLATASDAQLIESKSILLAPDYVINPGGLIHVAYQYHQATEAAILEKVEQIYDTTLEVFERAVERNSPPSEVADHIALERLATLKAEKGLSA